MAAFTVYWGASRLESLPREDPGPRLSVLFGGPHRSQPSFLRARVEVGDDVFPITVRERRLLVLAGTRVRQIVSVDETDPEMGWPLPRFAEWSFLAPHVHEQGRHRTWRFPSRRGGRSPKHVAGEVVARQHSFDGIYEVDDRTAAALAELTGRTTESR